MARLSFALSRRVPLPITSAEKYRGYPYSKLSECAPTFAWTSSRFFEKVLTSTDGQHAMNPSAESVQTVSFSRQVCQSNFFKLFKRRYDCLTDANSFQWSPNLVLTKSFHPPFRLSSSRSSLPNDPVDSIYALENDISIRFCFCFEAPLMSTCEQRSDISLVNQGKPRRQ
jgi:hypothetical protein